MTRALLALLLMSCHPAAGGDAPPPSQAPPGFWNHWGDGKAELAGYALTQPRYGELRRGEAVLVTVSETFTRAQRVKSDGGHDDEFPVLKLNEVRDFQTGIYDYNVLTSAFVPLDGSQSLGLATKLSLSVQEWCGNAWDQLVVDEGTMHRVRHSYFDGEGDVDQDLDVPRGGVMGDALPLLVRDLAGPLVGPGESIERPFLPPLLDPRLSHEPLAWTTARIERSAGTETLQVSAGSFEVSTVTVAVAGGDTTTYRVEAASPHRLVAWERSNGEAAVLTGVIRTPYWQEHGEGDEALRAQLGLPAHTWP